MEISSESRVAPFHQVLTAFFEQVNHGELSVIDRVDSFAGDVFFELKSAHLVFSLSGLHQLLFDESIVSYSEFKRSLYQGQFNASLAGLGLRVDVYRASGKVATSLYQLVSIGEVSS